MKKAFLQLRHPELFAEFVEENPTVVDDIERAMAAENKVILELPPKSGQIIGKFLIFIGLYHCQKFIPL